MDKNHGYSFSKIRELVIKYKPWELAKRGIAANKLKRNKETIGIYHPSRSVKQIALIHRRIAADLALLDDISVEKMLDEETRYEQDVSARAYDRAFAIDGMNGVVYQKGDTYLLVNGENEAEVIHPSENQIPKVFNTTFEYFLKHAKIKG